MERLNQSGFITISLVVVVALLMFLTVETMNIYRVYSYVRTELTQIANGLVVSSIAKESREGQLFIDENLINLEQDIIYERFLISLEDQTLNFTLTHLEIEIAELELELKCRLTIYPAFLSTILENLKLEIPINVKSEVQFIG